MAVTYIPTKSGQGYIVLCLAADVKPTSTTPGSLIETDTGKSYFPDGIGGWTLETDSGITQLTGDIAAGPGNGSVVATLPNIVSADTKTKITYNAKGQVTVGATATLASADFANQGTTTTVLHGNAAGNPAFGSVVAGDIASDAVTTVKILDDNVTYAKMQNAAANTFIARAASSSGDLSEVALAASQLAGRGSTGDVAAIVLGAGISMSGTTLNFAGGAGGAWVQLDRQVLGSDTTPVTFNSISGSYNHLKLVITGKDTVSAAVTSMFLRFNNDSGSNYDTQYDYGINGTAAVIGSSLAQTSGLCGSLPGATSGRADTRGQVEIFIADYATTVFEKTAYSLVGIGSLLAGAGSGPYVGAITNGWRNTAAITRVDLIATTNFKTGSIFTLYGIT